MCTTQSEYQYCAEPAGWPHALLSEVVVSQLRPPPPPPSRRVCSSCALPRRRSFSAKTRLCAHIPRATPRQCHATLSGRSPRPGHTALGLPAARGAAPHSCPPPDTVSTGVHATLEPQNSQLTRAVRHQEVERSTQAGALWRRSRPEGSATGSGRVGSPPARPRTRSCTCHGTAGALRAAPAFLPKKCCEQKQRHTTPERTVAAPRARTARPPAPRGQAAPPVGPRAHPVLANGTGARVRGAPLQRVGQDHVDVIVGVGRF